MNNICINGYGFYADEVSDETVKRFILSHKDTLEKLHQADDLLRAANDKETPLEEDFFGYPCRTTGEEGVYAIISSIIAVETKIRFGYLLGDEQKEHHHFIVYRPSYPWKMSKREQDLTEDILKEVAKKYAEELGIKDVGFFC